MALLTLDRETSDTYIKEKERLENVQNGCKIEVKENSVHIYIPTGNDPSTCRDLVFSKSDMRKLLEELYIM